MYADSESLASRSTSAATSAMRRFRSSSRLTMLSLSRSSPKPGPSLGGVMQRPSQNDVVEIADFIWGEPPCVASRVAPSAGASGGGFLTVAALVVINEDDEP